MAKQKLSDRARQQIEQVQKGESASLSLIAEGLHDIRDEIFLLESLEELYLNVNELRVVPDRIRKLNLKTLDVSRNPIEQLPDIPGLRIDFRTYRRLAGTISPQNIKALQILPMMIREGGDLIEIFGSLRTLEGLYIHDISVTEFPAGIRNLISLRSLDPHHVRNSGSARMDCRVAASQPAKFDRERFERVSKRSFRPEFLALSRPLRHVANPRDPQLHLAAGEPSRTLDRYMGNERTARRGGRPRGRSDQELLAAAPRRRGWTAFARPSF